MILIATMSRATAGAMLELAYVSLALLGVFLIAWIITSILKVRNMRLRDSMRKKQDASGDIGDRLDLVEVLPDLNKEEMKRMAIKEKERKAGQEEKINLDNYEGLPLKPKVYFDPEKDKGPPDEKPPEPKIQRSILSNEPFPKEEVASDAQSADSQKEEVTAPEPSPWMPIGKPLSKDTSESTPDADDEKGGPEDRQEKESD